MKKYKTLILGAIVVGLIVVVVQKWDTKEVVQEGITPVGEVRELCYIWNTEGGDKASLRMAIDASQHVTGSYAWLPAQKDSKQGPFVGTAGSVDPKAMARTAELLWTASGEGITNKEELRIMFGEGIASIGMGEMKLREADGVYVYADPEKIVYSSNLQQTDCNDPAL